MKKLLFSLLFIATIFVAFAANGVDSRQRNTIFVLDCTRSMAGYDGAPNIWGQTKDAIKKELTKESKESPDAKVTIIPFQDKVYSPIAVDLKNYD